MNRSPVATDGDEDVESISSEVTLLYDQPAILILVYGALYYTSYY